jgi:hypothetical protein
MTTLILDTEPLTVQVNVTDGKLVIEMIDGRSLSVPLCWYSRLLHAPSQELQNEQILGGGYAIEWANLDEHIGIEGLLAGKCSGESSKSFERWLATRIK